jgi:hypothetical protein
MKKSIGILCVCGLAGSVMAQPVEVGGPVGAATGFLDFDNPPVPVGPIAGNSPVFTSVGISNVSLFGSFTTGDAMGSGVNGNALVSTGGGAGTLTVQAPGGPMDNLSANSGFRFEFSVPVISFGFVFVDQVNHQVDVTLYSGGMSLGTATFTITSPTGGFPVPPKGWVDAQGRNYDAIEISSGAVGDGGWGPDDIWVEAIPAPGSVALLGLGGLLAARRRR